MKNKINKRKAIIYLFILLVSCTKYHEEYHDNGELYFRVALDNSDNYTGIGSFYSDDGILISEFSYEKGKKHGLAKLYFPNGNLEKVWNYKYGMSHGINKVFDIYGNLIYREVAENDTIVYYSKFNDKGQLIEENRFIEIKAPDNVLVSNDINVCINISGLLYDKGQALLSYKIDNIENYTEDISFKIICKDSLQGMVNLKFDSVGTYVFKGNFRVYDSMRVGRVYDFNEKINVSPPARRHIK